MADIQAMTRTMIYLIACALHDERPEDRYLTDVDLSVLRRTAKSHSLAALVCMALEKTDTFAQADAEIKKQWMDAKNKAIRKSIMLDAERMQILAELEKAQIWYMPLKGSVLKYYYPHPGTREMADIDILYDSSRQKDVKAIFLNRGYAVVSMDKGNHDIYKKTPVYNFEMHRSLLPESIVPELAASYQSPDRLMQRDADNAYGFHLKNEDFYVYVTSHAYKHYSLSGTGLRTLVDWYVLNHTFDAEMDRSYISAQLNMLGLADFEQTGRQLAMKLFGNARMIDPNDLLQEERIMLEQCCTSGTYGTIENMMKNELTKLAKDGRSTGKREKALYVFHRIFPSRKWCKDTYPFFYHVPVLIPFLWIYRIPKALIISRGKVLREMNALKETKS